MGMINAFHWREFTGCAAPIKRGHCPPKLTQERINDLMSLVDQGYTYAEIAKLRRVSVNTVMRYNQRRNRNEKANQTQGL